MNREDIPLLTLLKRLHLPTVARLLPEMEVKAAAEGWTHRDFLAVLIAGEVAHRNDTRIERFTRKAHFPFLRTIEEFDFLRQTALRRPALGPYLGPEFVTEGRNLILSGKPGRGKTHLAIALAYRAIQNGFDARFTTAAALIDHLSAASQRGQLREVTAEYVQPDVLVIDEIGYLHHANDAANVLYGVIDQRHLKRRPLLLTTNKPLQQLPPTAGPPLGGRELRSGPRPARPRPRRGPPRSHPRTRRLPPARRALRTNARPQDGARGRSGNLIRKPGWPQESVADQVPGMAETMERRPSEFPDDRPSEFPDPTPGASELRLP